jgi:glutathione S-transferase
MQVKLYDADDPAPNPRRVRIFLREKGLDVPMVSVSLAKGEHKRPEFLALNSLGQVPVLELADGSTLTESVSICRWLEEQQPEPPLFGASAVERARIDMWLRRIELRVTQPLGMVWVHAHPFTAAFMKTQGRRQFRDFGEHNLELFANACRWLDGEIDGRPFLAGDRYSIADIVAQTTFDLGAAVGIDLPADCGRVRDWYSRVSARPSAALDLSRFPVALAREQLAKALTANS